MSSEAVIQQQTRLLAAREGLLMYRNNSGAMLNEMGQMVRFGLGNDSAQLNEVMKTSDLVGGTPVTAYLQSVGWCKLLVFTEFECKPKGWHMTQGDKRAKAQNKHHEIVREAGGFAGFVTDPSDIYRIIRRE